MPDYRVSARLQGLLWAFLFLAVVWAPLEGLFLYGLGQAQDALIEAASAVRQRELAGTLLRFRCLLQPEEALTLRLQQARREAASAPDPQTWMVRAKDSLADFPPNSFDLFLTDGRTILPDYPGWDPATLSAFLATCTLKADSITSVESMISCMRRLRKDLDFVGNERFSAFRWIPLPVFPGIPNRIFDRAWRNDTMVFGFNTPRNSWAAFGHVGDFPGWRYLLVLHRQHLGEHFLTDLAMTEIRRRGLPVSLRPVGQLEQAPDQGASAPRAISGRLERNGRALTLTDFDEKLGVLQAHGDLPLSLWTVWALALLANGAFSFAGLVMLFRATGAIEGAGVPVSQRIFLGLLVGTGLPLLMVLVVGQGMVGTKIFRDLQTWMVDMDQSMRGVEEDFNRYLEKVSLDYRAFTRRIPVPYSPRTGIPLIERMCGSHQAAAIHLLDADGNRLLTRGPFTWPVFHLAKLSPPDLDAFLLERIPRGAYLLEHEIELLTLSPSLGSAARDLAARRILFREGRKTNQFFSPQMFSIISRMVCRAFDRGSAITSRDVEESKSGVLLNLFLQGREVEFLNDTLARLGTLATFKMAGFEGLSFLDVALDAEGKSAMVVLVFHRLSNICDQFLRLRFLRPPRGAGSGSAGGGNRRGADPFFGAISQEPLKLDFGPVLPPQVKDLMRRGILEVERPVSFLLASGPVGPCLVLAKRSARLPAHIIFVTLPLERLAEGSRALSRWLGSGLLLLFLLVGGASLALRRVFLDPLYNLQECVNAMARLEATETRAAPAVGEMGRLADLFNQTLDGLRQMNIARAVQESLFPQGGLRVGNFALEGHSVMMSQVGGDYYDLLPAGPDRILVVVGDVAGHGLPAAIVMAMLKSGLTVLAAEPLGTDEIARELNETLLRLLARTKMMTCFLGCLEPASGTFSFTNAGHNFPLLVPARGESRFLKQTNLPLGSLKNRAYKKDELRLEPGDTLIICTDGILEAQDPQEQMLGYEGFRAWLAGSQPSDPRLLIRTIMEKVDRYTGGGPAQDDLTILAVCHVPPSVVPPASSPSCPRPAPERLNP